MRKALLILMWAASVSAALAADGEELAQRAGELARAGSTQEALMLYRQALTSAPGDPAIRMDFATVLGWAEQYAESIREFEALRGEDPNLPGWALREMARSELFGGRPDRALTILDDLIQGGDRAEATLCRRALTLRWLQRSVEAERAYRQVLVEYPSSIIARLGVIYSLADQDQLERALAAAEQALATAPGNWELLKARGQVLNWLGRHQAAQRAFDAVPAEHQNDRELLEGRIAAARWGGEPARAQSAAGVLASTWPDYPDAERLRRELSLEYGRALAPSFRFASDNDGFSEELFEQDFILHAGAAHRVQFGMERRQFSLDRDLVWRRYNLGWTGNLSPRWSAYASVGTVEYTDGSTARRLVGDISVSYAVGDRVRLTAGGGSMAMDAFRAVENHVAGAFFYVETATHPSRNLSLEANYSHYRFSDGVLRDRVRVEAFRRLLGGRKVRLDVGGAGNTMWHDRQTSDFFSPASFFSGLGEVRASGRLSSRLEYVTQFGAGAQREVGYAVQSPLLATGTIFLRLSPRLMLRTDVGRSTSSLERINPGRPSYARTVVAVSLNFRFE